MKTLSAAVLLALEKIFDNELFVALGAQPLSPKWGPGNTCIQLRIPCPTDDFCQVGFKSDHKIKEGTNMNFIPPQEQMSHPEIYLHTACSSAELKPHH